MGDYTGYHIAFDTNQGRHVYKFNATESGDAIALNLNGAIFPALNLAFQN
jgi:hypothetical protein